MSGTNIDASKLTFRSISSTGAANGIALSNTGSAGGLAVTGVAETLTALFNGQADELLIDAAPANLGFNEQGVRAAVKPYDEDAATSLDFGDPRVVADELVRRAQATDAGITFIEDSSLLEEVGGAGALLRYRI